VDYVWLGGAAVGRRIRDREVASSIPGCSAARCNSGQVVHTRVPLFTKQYKKAQLTQGLCATAPSLQDGGCSKMAVSRHLGFYRTANSAIRSADPENPCLEQNMEWI